MKKSLKIFVGSLSALLLVLAITNPSLGQLRDHYGSIRSFPKIVLEDGTNYARESNYFVASVFVVKTHCQIQRKGEKETLINEIDKQDYTEGIYVGEDRFIGILGNFYQISYN
jgi:hypothetical protein